MKINYQESDISFGTKIKFVSPKDFSNIRKSFFFSSASKDFIYAFDILKNCKTSQQCYRVNSPKTCTDAIRTCIGIVVTDLKNKSSSLFAHLFHSSKNLCRMEEIKPYVKGDNAIIIGQRRDKYAFSSEIYDKFLNYCQANKMQVTKLRGLRTGFETDMSYDGKSDTLYVCVSKINNKNKYVSNIERLKYAFKEISIAPCDNIQFLKEGSVKIKYNFFQILYNMIVDRFF